MILGVTLSLDAIRGEDLKCKQAVLKDFEFLSELFVTQYEVLDRGGVGVNVLEYVHTTHRRKNE